MGREVRSRREPHLPRVQRIELSDSHVKVRLTAAVLLLAAGVALIVFSLVNLLSAEAGWQEIEAEAAELHCGGDFSFLYELGAEEISANREKKQLTALYSDAAKTAYEIFNVDLEVEGVSNLWYINHHPNEEISVDTALYNALSQVCESNARWIYLGPAYSIYDNLFYMASPEGAVDFDPRLNSGIRELFQEICRFANDPQAVNLELMEEDVVKLNVSQEYLDFAAAEELEDFLDFYWLKNAFIADYMADRIQAEGYSHGVISSYDGFARNFDDSGAEFFYQLYHSESDLTLFTAVLEYSSPQSFASFRSYPVNSRDLERYLILSDGSIRTPYLDMEEGLDRCSIGEITVYSENMGCAEIALMTAPVYIEEIFQKSALLTLAEAGIYTVFWENDGIYNNGPLPVNKENL